MNLPALLSDPSFWIAGSIAMSLFGLSKGGFSGLSALGLPIFALALPPMQAAAIMLPVLMVQDVVGLWAFRRDFDRKSLGILLVGAVAGTVLAGLTAAYVPQAAIILMVGLIGFIFGGQWWLQRLRKRPENPAYRPTDGQGLFWGMMCGITSFIAHVGGPAVQVYLMPQRLKPAVFAGTLTWLFAVVNVVKVFPYIWLGQFSSAGLMASVALMPVAALSTLVGIWLVKRISPARFYPVIYALLTLIGCKLIWDGLRGLQVF
jgi:uncharacterized protein